MRDRRELKVPFGGTLPDGWHWPVAHVRIAYSMLATIVHRAECDGVAVFFEAHGSSGVRQICETELHKPPLAGRYLALLVDADAPPGAWVETHVSPREAVGAWLRWTLERVTSPGRRR